MAVLAIRRTLSTPTISIGGQGGGGAYSPIGASFDAVYTQNLYSDFGVASTAAAIHSVTRASTKYVEDTSGLWTSVSANTLARSNKGALIEESRTNSIRNNSMQGAVAGTPGTLPTNWSQSQSTGITPSVVGAGTSNGIEYIDIRFVGTAVVGDNNLFFETSTSIDALTGQAWTMAPFIAISGGATTNISQVRWSLIELDSGGTPVTSGASSAISLTATLTRYPYTRTLSGGGTVAKLRPLLLVNPTAGAVDITLRIGWPQLELGAFATSPIRTTSAAATRAADVITIDPKYASFTQGGTFVETENVLGPVGTNRVSFAMVAAGTNEIYTLTQSSNKETLIIQSGGAPQVGLVSTNNVVSNSIYKAAFRHGLNDTAIALTSTLTSGVSADTTCTMPTGTPTIALGSISSSSFLNGYLRRLTLYPRKLTDAELGALVA